MAHHAGVTVFAVLLAETLPAETLNPLVRRLGEAGADKVLLAEAAGLGAPPLDVTHGPALHSIAERISPVIVLFPAGGAGLELGPTLAARLNGAFAGTSDLVLSADDGALPDGAGRVVLRRWRGNRGGYRLLDPVEIERPVVAILGGSGRSDTFGTAEVEVEIVACAAPSQSAIVELHSEPDPHARLELARMLVVLGRDVPAAAADKLAALTGGDLAVADQREVPAAALAGAAPALWIEVTGRIPAAMGSPATTVGLVVPPGGRAVAGPPAGVDAEWNVPAGTAWDDELVQALLSLRDDGQTEQVLP